MRRSMLALAVVAAVAAFGAGCSSKTHAKTVRVAAASDLSRAFDEVGKAFEAKTGIHPIFDFGSSGLLAKQIAQGAPYALFAAANKQYADDVVAAGRCDAASMRTYARGKIVVWCPAGVAAPSKLADLADPRFERIAIANPDHAPYGRAAKQALTKAGVWDAVASKIVVAESVHAAMQYAQSKTVPAAIVALSLAVVTDGGTSLAIDPADYEPLDQQLVVCGSGADADAARRLVDFIASSEGKEIMQRYGFAAPPQAAAAGSGGAP